MTTAMFAARMAGRSLPRIRAAQVNAPAAPKEKSSSEVFSETESAQPRRMPPRKSCRECNRPLLDEASKRISSASNQQAFQRLSVRNSRDFRKKVGKTLSSSVAQTATRVSYNRRASVNAANVMMSQRMTIGARMKSRTSDRSPSNRSSGAEAM